MILSGKREGGLINITHKEAVRRKWLLSSHVAANYSNTLRHLTGLKTGTWSEQHCDMHNLFKALPSDLINIANGTFPSSDVNVDSSIDSEKGIVQKVVNKSLP